MTTQEINRINKNLFKVLNKMTKNKMMKIINKLQVENKIKLQKVVKMDLS